MALQFGPVDDRPFASRRWDSVPFGRWWRKDVVGTVDHQRVVTRIIEESGLTPRYAFMTAMSAGIAVLGLLLSSPAVVIGAMLISPLMSPILGLGFSLALFDFPELRRSVIAFGVGCLLAVLFSAALVLLSPIQAPTPEILARTRPNLFDLLVALFAGLAGTFAIIRGRGDTIVGVAIATALMPPLAVVGYGLATRNMPVLTGSAALFGANFVTIALSATALARLFGFGHYLSARQGWAQTAVLLVAFAGMAIPLALSLEQIAREASVVNQVRAYLGERFGPTSRVTQLDIDFRREPLAIRSVVIAPRDRATSLRVLHADLQARLGRPLDLQVDEILLDPSAGARAEEEALARANAVVVSPARDGASIAEILALVAGVAPDSVTVDQGRRRAVATAAPLPGAGLGAYRALERRAAATADGWTAATAQGWTVLLVPPQSPLPPIAFTSGSDTLEQEARDAVLLSAWAARRWNVRRLAVPGLPEGTTPPERPTLSQRRALAIAGLLRESGLVAAPAPATPPPLRLVPAPPA